LLGAAVFPSAVFAPVVHLVIYALLRSPVSPSIEAAIVDDFLRIVILLAFARPLVAARFALKLFGIVIRIFVLCHLIVILLIIVVTLRVSFLRLNLRILIVVIAGGARRGNAGVVVGTEVLLVAEPAVWDGAAGASWIGPAARLRAPQVVVIFIHVLIVYVAAVELALAGYLLTWPLLDDLVLAQQVIVRGSSVLMIA
jgi:hypothetical protein